MIENIDYLRHNNSILVDYEKTCYYKDILQYSK